MAKLYFTSDLHFNHAKIIEYCKRPFKDVEEMNTVLIENNNKIVKDEDTVFDLGDFIFRNSPGGKEGTGGKEKPEYFLGQLKGKRIIVKGNHDGRNSLKVPIERIVINHGGYRINMVHNPAHVSRKYNLNFVGHVHDTWKFMELGKNSYDINVGVDVWEFKPVTFDDIISAFQKWRKENDEEKKARNENDNVKGGASQEVRKVV